MFAVRCSARPARKMVSPISSQSCQSMQSMQSMLSSFKTSSCSLSRICRMSQHSSPFVAANLTKAGNGVREHLLCSTRNFTERERHENMLDKNRKSVLMYLSSVVILFVGITYASVPMYRMFCQQMGWGGKAEQSKGHQTGQVATMKKREERVLTVHFLADTASSMRWNFKPIHNNIKIFPGETALAFYTATNPASTPVTGIATYNIIPIEAGAYFNKIQCFCFEEQRLNPKEQVDMPVFFFIDPEYCNDHRLENIDDIYLSYHFFEAKVGLRLPLPDELPVPAHAMKAVIP